MSYILDALKKVEHEKSKKSRVTGMINLSGSLFEHERSKPERKAGWKIALAVTAAVLLTFALTWHFLPALTGRGPVSPKPVAQVPQTLPVKVEPTPAPAALAPPAGMPSAQPTVPSTQHPAPPLPLQPTASKPLAAVQVMPANDDEDDETRRAARRRHKNLNVQASPASPVAATVAAPADLKLSGIAYQDERRARRAVVNGFLLQEGAVVSGAVITDIYQDRVRFSLAGKSFELSLAATGIPAAGK